MTLPLRVDEDFAGRQWCGKRESQQDSHAFAIVSGASGEPDGLLAVLADGMGGHQGGKFASETAVTQFITQFVATEIKSGTSDEEESARFIGALGYANSALARASEDPNLQGMGTTLLALTITQAGIRWLSVGDCALYVYQGNRLTRLNQDHSCRVDLEDAVRRGEMTQQEASVHPNRTKLHAALIGRSISQLDCRADPYPVAQGDLILAATDGLEILPEDELTEILSAFRLLSADAIAVALLNAAVAHGNPNQDNTSVIVIKCAEDYGLLKSSRYAVDDAHARIPTKILPVQAG